VLALPSELTHAQATACLASLVQGMRAQAPGAVALDASALNRFDSSALAVLLELQRQCRALGRTLSVNNLPDRLRDLAKLYGIADLLPLA
jgi:phospholipid transport system transporter-binding protein